MAGTTRSRPAPTRASSGAAGSPAARSPQLEALSRSTHFDWRLTPYDLAGSRAHANVLHAAGLLTDDDHAELLRGLDVLGSGTPTGRCSRRPADEDVHGALERLLLEEVGPERRRPAARRPVSRNDQVATLFKVYLRDHARVDRRPGARPGRGAGDQAETHLGAIMPGRTHLQHAQPVLLSHHLLAHALAAGPRRRAAARLGRPRRRGLAVRLGRAGRAEPRPRPRGGRRRARLHRLQRQLDRRHRRPATSWRSSRS